MITRTYYYTEESTDPFYNLGIEQHLLDIVPKGSCILYLWQNKHTVVIGKNQNAYAEVNLPYADAHGITVSRRINELRKLCRKRSVSLTDKDLICALGHAVTAFKINACLSVFIEQIGNIVCGR